MKYKVFEYVPEIALQAMRAEKYSKDSRGFLRDEDGSCPLGVICCAIGEKYAPIVPAGREFAEYLLRFNIISEDEVATVTNLAWRFIIDWERGNVSSL